MYGDLFFNQSVFVQFVYLWVMYCTRRCAALTCALLSVPGVFLFFFTILMPIVMVCMCSNWMIQVKKIKIKKMTRVRQFVLAFSIHSPAQQRKVKVGMGSTLEGARTWPLPASDSWTEGFPLAETSPTSRRPSSRPLNPISLCWHGWTWSQKPPPKKHSMLLSAGPRPPGDCVQMDSETRSCHFPYE